METNTRERVLLRAAQKEEGQLGRQQRGQSTQGSSNRSLVWWFILYVCVFAWACICVCMYTTV